MGGSKKQRRAPSTTTTVRMPSLPHQWPRGPTSDLHQAAFDGSTSRLVALLSDGPFDIDEGSPSGRTPLMMASCMGHPHVVRILLNKGADVSIVPDDGHTALHNSAQEGHVAVSKMLVNAGADLEAVTVSGGTPLHLCAEKGNSEVMSVLIEAGANLDSRGFDGGTPLFMAAQNGHLDALKVLLRAKADPLLTKTDPRLGEAVSPFEMAAQYGHSEVVRELVRQVGIERCGGASRGENALRVAALFQQLDTMAVLADAGVVDTGMVLLSVTAAGCELSVKLLLQLKGGKNGGRAAYANLRDTSGGTPLLIALGLSGISCPSPFPRIVRLLVDAGANTASVARVTNSDGKVKFLGTPLAIVSRILGEKKIAGKDATEEHLHRLERARRLLLRVEAVHAVSLLWPVGIPSVIATATEGTARTVVTLTPLRMMLPILRRRARKPRVLLAALFRCGWCHQVSRACDTSRGVCYCSCFWQHCGYLVLMSKDLYPASFLSLPLLTLIF